MLFLHGKQDEIFPLSEVEKLYTALLRQYEAINQQQCLAFHAFEHWGHQLDLETAQSSPEIQQDLTKLQQVIAAWFSQHLVEAE
jgi:predicted esterase